MKRLGFAIFVSAWILSCSDNNITALPETDVNNYISGNTVTFPRGTRAIDIYNTVVSIYQDNDYHEVTSAKWEYIYTSTSNGLTNQTWQSTSFTKIRHTHLVHESGVNTHTVYLYTSDTSTREIIFEWQRQTTNVWKNAAIEGDITFIF